MTLAGPFEFIMLLYVVSEIPNHLYGHSIVIVVVITVDVIMELTTIRDNRNPPLLKGQLHVFSGSRPNVIPIREGLLILFYSGRVLRTHAAPLGIGEVFVSKRAGKLLRAPK